MASVRARACRHLVVTSKPDGCSSGMNNLSEVYAAVSLQNLGSQGGRHRNIACGLDCWASLFGVGERFDTTGRPLWQLIGLGRANRSGP